MPTPCLKHLHIQSWVHPWISYQDQLHFPVFPEHFCLFFIAVTLLCLPLTAYISVPPHQPSPIMQLTWKIHNSSSQDWNTNIISSSGTVVSGNWPAKSRYSTVIYWLSLEKTWVVEGYKKIKHFSFSETPPSWSNERTAFITDITANYLITSCIGEKTKTSFYTLC